MASGIMVSEKLLNYAERYRGMPYALGHNDCFLFCLRWAGNRLRSEYNYHGIKGALATLEKHSVDRSYLLFDRHFSRTNKPKTGDLCGWDEGALGGCGIVLDDGVYLSIDESCGLVATQEPPNLFWSVTNGQEG